MTPRYREHDPALAAHVHCTESFEAHEDGTEQAIPPDGRPELIVHRGRPYEERSAHGAWYAQSALRFAGQLTRPLVLRSRDAVEVLASRFAPACAWAFAGVSMATLTDRRVALAAPLRRSGRHRAAHDWHRCRDGEIIGRRTPPLARARTIRR